MSVFNINYFVCLSMIHQKRFYFPFLSGFSQRIEKKYLSVCDRHYKHAPAKTCLSLKCKYELQPQYTLDELLFFPKITSVGAF